jgi:hypothetical protein
MDGIFILLVLAIVVIYIYFLPSVFAVKFNHSKYSSIFIINLFLGWALIPWVLTLAWAFSESNKVDNSQ